MSRVIAAWSSRGGQWTSELVVTEDGYRLVDKKHGHECGAAWRPKEFFNDEAEAIIWAERQVAGGFDVKMKRTQ
jgi:hypothetical protein